jgi:hypothetical protein
LRRKKIVEITVNIKAPELAKALETLALSLSGYNIERIKETGVVSLPLREQQVQSAPIQNVPQTPVQTYQPPTAVPTAPAQQAPIQPPPVPQQPTAVPTSAPTYDLNQLAVAATQLVDAGRMADIQQLIASFGVPALTGLPQEQYGAFATKLRELGAKI